MILTHPFLNRCYDLNELFFNVKTLSHFCRNLEKQSIKDPDRYPTKKYLGDGWEFFCEALIKTHQYDNRVGIFDYVPVIRKDNGVDGYGININGKLCALQHKYRSNKNLLLTATDDKLDSFISQSIMVKKIVPDKKYRHYVFTTAKGLNCYTEHENFLNNVKCYGYLEIRKLVDNNIHFWNFIRSEINKFNEKLKNI
jgi:hypothetical protein